MCRYVEDLVDVCKALWAPGSPLFELDRVPPMPFDHSLYSPGAPLRIGYYLDGEDGYVYPAPCATVRRAMEETIANLKARGHTLVPFAPNQETVAPWAKIDAVYIGLYGGGKRDEAEPPPPKVPKDPKANVGSYGGGPLEGEEIHPDLARGYAGPPREATDSAPGRAQMLPRPDSMAKYHDVVAQRDLLRDSFARAWRDADLDVLLCPSCNPHDHCWESVMSASNNRANRGLPRAPRRGGTGAWRLAPLDVHLQLPGLPGGCGACHHGQRGGCGGGVRPEDERRRPRRCRQALRPGQAYHVCFRHHVLCLSHVLCLVLACRARKECRCRCRWWRCPGGRSCASAQCSRSRCARPTSCRP